MADRNMRHNINSLFKGTFESKVTYRQSLSLPTDYMSFSQTGFVRLFTSVDRARITTVHEDTLIHQQFKIKKGG